MTTPADIEVRHISALMQMPADHRLAIAREVLAAIIREKAARAKKPEIVTRRQSLDAVFAAEAEAIDEGRAYDDVFLPLENEMMEGL